MDTLETYTDRLARIVNDGYCILSRKIHSGRISIDNEASLQLHYSSVLKTLGELYEFAKADLFSIELEKSVFLTNGAFVKSKSENARIDIFLKLEDRNTRENTSCAIELKFFKRKNFREPNNRYDVFKDLSNLEKYGDECDLRYFVIGTDHAHYVDQPSYSNGTRDFDFRNKKKYMAGAQLVYNTPKPYGPPLMLSNSYDFKWDMLGDKYYFMKLEVPKKA